MTTEHLLTGIGIVLGLIAFGVLTYMNILDDRDQEIQGDLDDFIRGQEISNLRPIEPLEGAVTPEERLTAETIELVNQATIDALIANRTLALEQSQNLRERRRRRRYLTRAGLVATAGASVIGLVALFT